MAPLVLDRESERRIDEAYKEAQGPVPFRTQSERYVVMTASDYALLAPSLSEEDASSLSFGYEDVKHGRVRDLSEVLDELGAQYGF